MREKTSVLSVNINLEKKTIPIKTHLQLIRSIYKRCSLELVHERLRHTERDLKSWQAVYIWNSKKIVFDCGGSGIQARKNNKDK